MNELLLSWETSSSVEAVVTLRAIFDMRYTQTHTHTITHSQRDLS